MSLVECNAKIAGAGAIDTQVDKRLISVYRRMNDWKEYLWLVKTSRGDFFIEVLGNWTQEEAARTLRVVFDMIKLDITAMIPRKRASGPDDLKGIIYQQEEPEDLLGFAFLAGKKLWQVCGRGAEYEAELIRLEREG